MNFDLKYHLINDRDIIIIQGEDSNNFLQGLISNDMNKVNATNAIYACLLTPQGKYFADLFISKKEDKFFLEINKARFEEILAKFLLYKLRSKIEIIDGRNDYNIAAIYQDSLPHIEEAEIIYRDPRSRTLPYRMIISKKNDLTPNLAEKEYEAKRIEEKIPEGDKDLIKDKSFPLEYGLDNLGAIDFHKGCYVGQEVTSRTKHRGVVRKKIYKITASTSLPSLESELWAGENKLGHLTSSCDNIGLALIRIEEYEKAKVENVSFFIENNGNKLPITLEE